MSARAVWWQWATICTLWIFVAGCGTKTPRPQLQETASSGQQPSSITSQLSDSADRPAEASRLETTSAQSEDVPPPTATSPQQPVFSHPIDNLQEGKAFRAAVDALDRGNLQAAEEIRRQLAEHPQFGVLSTAISAIAMVKGGELQQALKMAEEISTIPIMQAEAYAIAGEVFYRQGKLNQAAGAFEGAIGINPEHARAHVWLGATYYDTGAMADATKHLRTAAALIPTDTNSLMFSGKIFREYEKFDDAIVDFQEVLRRSPPSEIAFQAQLQIAESYLRLRQVDSARETLDSMIKTADVLAMRAAIEEMAGNLARAEQAAREATELSPGHSKAALVLGRILLTERKWQEAVEVLEPVVASQPTEHEPRFLLSRGLLGAGRGEEGREQANIANEWKRTFLKFADLNQDAIQRPTDVMLRVELGKLAEKLGRVPLAASWYRAALGLDPDCREAIDALARLAQQAPNRDESTADGKQNGKAKS